jgi:hypothetical protein
MTRYLISFGAHAMDHIPDEEMPAVAKASHEVVQEAINAGVWVFGGGLENQKASIVATDGTVTDGPYPEAIGGLCVVEVPSHKEALEWAAMHGSAADRAVPAAEAALGLLGRPLHIRAANAPSWQGPEGDHRLQRVAESPGSNARSAADLASAPALGQSRQRVTSSPKAILTGNGSLRVSSSIWVRASW